MSTTLAGCLLAFPLKPMFSALSTTIHPLPLTLLIIYYSRTFPPIELRNLVMSRYFLLSALYLIGFLLPPPPAPTSPHVHFSEEPILQVRRNGYLWGGGMIVNGKHRDLGGGVHTMFQWLFFFLFFFLLTTGTR